MSKDSVKVSRQKIHLHRWDIGLGPSPCAVHGEKQEV